MFNIVVYTHKPSNDKIKILVVNSDFITFVYIVTFISCLNWFLKYSLSSKKLCSQASPQSPVLRLSRVDSKVKIIDEITVDLHWSVTRNYIFLKLLDIMSVIIVEVDYIVGSLSEFVYSLAKHLDAVGVLLSTSSNSYYISCS